MADRADGGRVLAEMAQTQRERRGRWHRRAALSILTLALLSAHLVGCGVGGGLAASGGGGGGGGGPPPRPTSEIELGAADDVGREDHPAGNLVRLRYRLTHVNAKHVNVFPEFRLPQDGDWKAMTLVGDRNSDPTRRLAVDKSGGEFSVLWNTLVDLPRPASLNPTTRFILNVRVRFEYVDQRTPGLVIVREPLYYIDYNLAATVASDEVAPLPTGRGVPAGLAVVSDGLLVANAKADTVDHLALDGVVTRRIGRGVFLPPDGFTEPGVDISNRSAVIATSELDKLLRGSTGDPAAVQPRALLGLTTDGNGGVFTANHYFLAFATFDPVPRIRVLNCANFIPGEGFFPGLGPACCHRPAYHPSGVLLYTDTTFISLVPLIIRNRIMATNPQDPAAPGATPLTFAGQTIAPGACAPVYDTTLDPSSRPQQARIHGLVVGPSGEVCFDERDADDLDHVLAFNPTSASLRVGAVTIPPGAVRDISAPYRIVAAGRPVDGRGVSIWDDVQDGGHDGYEYLTLSVARDVGVLFVGVPSIGDQSVVALDLLPDRASPPVFAGISIPRAATTQAGVRLVCDSTNKKMAPGCQRSFGPGPINAIEASPDGTRLFIAQANDVVLVNGGASDLTAYGLPTPLAPGELARVYDATIHSGVPISSPSGIAARGDDLVFFSDDRAIRAVNLSKAPINVGRIKIQPGAFDVIGGASLPGFSEDGAVEVSRFDHPAAMAASLQNALFVADTGNHRVRLVHIGDPAAADSLNQFGKSVTPGNVVTVAGEAPGGGANDGDGGPPNAASLLSPQGLALRLSDGVLFVSDTGHHRIRAMNPGSSPVTIAGIVVGSNSIRTIIGDGCDSAVTPTLGDPCFPAALGDESVPGRVSSPTALVISGDLLYFADAGVPRIRALNMSTDRTVTLAGSISIPPGEIRTICGSGVRGYDGDGQSALLAKIDDPRGISVAVDGIGNPIALYFADGASNVLRVVNLSTGLLALGTDATGRPDFGSPVTPGSVATVSATSSGNSLQCGAGTAVGSESAAPSDVPLSMPRGVVVVRARDSSVGGATLDAASVFVADCGGNRVVRFPVARRTQ